MAAPLRIRIRRFGQVIRQAGHVGNRVADLESGHRVKGRSRKFGSTASEDGPFVREKLQRGTEMHGNGSDLQGRKMIALIFALLSGLSAASLAVLPAIA
jgi:hypothetical protein